MKYTKGGVIGTLLVFAAAATCIRLGIWQLDRLEQRDMLNAAIEQRTAERPLDLSRMPADTSGLTYRRAMLRGRCDLAHPVVLAGRSRRGAPGAELLCAFLPASGGAAIVVERGWAGAADARSVPPEVLVADEVGDTVGVLLMPFPAASGARAEQDVGERPATMDEGPAVVYRMNHGAVSAALPHPVAPLYGRRLSDDTGALAPPEPLDLSRGPHLGYAVQWFSFAGVALLGWVALVFRRGTGPGTRAPHPPGGTGPRTRAPHPPGGTA